MTSYYTVLEIRQVGGSPLLYGDLYDDRDRAILAAQEYTQGARARGRRDRYVVYELTEEYDPAYDLHREAEVPRCTAEDVDAALADGAQVLRVGDGTEEGL